MITGNKTYDQLYWDKEFVEKRIKEQEDYTSNVHYNWAIGNYPKGRGKQLYRSARAVLLRFQRQLENIKNLK
jgi:hypothetical protein